MATTYAILGLDAASPNADVDLKNFDATKFSLVDVGILQSGGREALYQRTDGDPQYPTTVRVGFYPTNGGINVSIKMSTYITATFDDLSIETKPCTAVFATTMPFGGGSGDNDDYVTMAQNLISWLLRTDVAGAVEATIATKLQFGIVDIL